MPEYLAPGVYVEEISTGPKPIEGVSTSNAGFLGATERGPEYLKLITSWLDFQRWYGAYIYNTSYLAYAVQGFFDNGGKRCFVGRITGQGASFSTGDFDNLRVNAIGRGISGNNIQVQIEQSSLAASGNQNAANWFKVSLRYFREMPANPDDVTPDVFEEFDDLKHEEGPNNVIKVLNSGSRLVRVWWNDPNAPARPGDEVFRNLADGVPGNEITAADFSGRAGLIGDPEEDKDQVLGRDTGFVGLSNVDEVALVLVPDEVRYGTPSPVSLAAVQHCERLTDRFAIVSAENGLSQTATVTTPVDTKYAGFYYPWIQIYDPSVDRYRNVPPSGHIAGIFARTDIERGVHKAPANEVVRGAFNLEFPVTKEQQDILNPKHVNCIRDFRADRRGIRLWGARTMSSDPEWKYVNVRRLFIFVEESIDEGTQWVVFEPNHEPTWAKVKRAITNFLISVWRSGGLMGVTQDEAFFVKCDRTTMTEDDINNGRLICYIGIAPVRPAEFVIFRISQKTIDATG